MAPTDDELARWEDEGGAPHPQAKESLCTGESTCGACGCKPFPSTVYENPIHDLLGE